MTNTEKTVTTEMHDQNRWRVTSDPEAVANAVDEAILRLVRLTV